MRIAFTQPWHQYKIGDELDIHPTQAMYLARVGLARFVDHPAKIAVEELLRPIPRGPQCETADAPPAAENADARPCIGRRKKRR